DRAHAGLVAQRRSPRLACQYPPGEGAHRFLWTLMIWHWYAWKIPTIRRSLHCTRGSVSMRCLFWSVLAVGAIAISPALAADTARYILPPGNFGGIPVTANSTDQLPLYSGLTPLRDNITPADIE